MPKKVLLFCWCIASGVVFSLGADPVVYSIEPTHGSLAGGTMVFLHGRGFANDQFNFHDPLLGNKILFKSDKHQVECHITPTDVSEKRIGCETEPSPTASDGEYELVMFVNGALVTRYCGRRQKCTFQFYKWRTPTIDDFSPRAAIPGTPVEIFGKIHTTQFSRLSPGFSPDNKEITRIYVGLECNPFNDETNELFGAELEDCGWTPNCHGSFRCLPKTRTPGSHSASYLVSLLGRSQVNKNLWRVDANQELYLYQTHSDIQSVSPSSGSLLGGTVITIGGEGFSDIAKNVKVFVAGVECEVLSSSLTQIECRTGPRQDVRSNYPGSRGLLREIWTKTLKSNLPDIAVLQSSAADYHLEYLTESNLPKTVSWNRTSGYSARVTGYFVPFQDDVYRFGILSDDASELYLSLTGDPSNKTKIASCSSATTNWDSNSVQESEPFSLEAGREYYIEAYHNDHGGSHHMKIRVGMEKTQHTSAEVGAVRDEKQKIRISSSVLWEKQILDFTNWNEDERVCEVQRLSLQPLPCMETNITSCNNTSDNFTLSYFDESITLSLQDTNSSILAQRLSELNAFTGRGQINVTSANVTEGNVTLFLIRFCFNDPRGIKLLNGTAQSNQTLNLTITPEVRGQSAQDFQLVIGGVPSTVLKPSSSIDKIEKTLKRWFSVECEESSLVGRIFYKDYEGENIYGRESGERVSDMQAFCGRYALKNPSILWKADYSAYLSDFPQPTYQVARYKWFCFAYKGPIKDQVSFRVKYRDSVNEERYSTRGYSFIRSSAQLSKWGFSCMDVWSKISEDFGDQAMSVKMYSIEISRLEGYDEDVFVDNVWIGKNQLLVTPVSSGAMPNGFIIKDYKIEKTTETNWTISLLPANCGSPMPLLSVVEYTGEENGNPNDVTYTTPGLNSTVRVRRVQEASPPVEGTFDIHYNGNVIKDIPVNISAMRLQDLFEQEFEEGIIEVERSGHCAEFEWTFTWKGHGGNHPGVTVNDSGLTGVQVTTTVTTIQDGGLFLDPIPGEFLRMPSTQTQVVVVVNEITGSCSDGNCTFEYSANQTPTLTSISPASGPGGPEGTGTVITLVGTGFSSNNDDNIVTIGGSACVINSSDTGSITCRADYGPGGRHLVQVLVNGKGLADNTRLLNFTYTITATSVSPASGSIAGGQVITISGSGFGNKRENASVLLDGSPCDVLSITMSLITCRTSAHSAGIVSVNISIDESSVTLSDAFEYNSSLTIDVTSVSPLQGRVSGGELITISGSGFLSETSVQVGDQTCAIQSLTGVKITCLAPPHAPGKFAIRLATPGKGFASIPTAYSTYEYLLEVHSIYPLTGSVAGGTHVTITGKGFGFNVSLASVTVHGKPCRVLSCNDTYVICETTDLFQTVEVDNSGSHPEFGLGYEWSPKHVTCYQGDTVKWNWAGQELSNAVYNVFQTRDSSSVQHDGSGFHSEAPSKTGSFSHRFSRTGVYFYAGGGSVTMKGIVKVLSFRTQSGPIQFVVDGIEAVYNLSSSPVPSTTCEFGRTDSFPGCNSSQAVQNSGGDGYDFTYSECSTPKVSAVTPSNGTSDATITINGRGFSDESCHNKLKFGSHVCDVISSSETEITCKLNTARSPVAGLPRDVSVKVLNRGYAFVQADVGETTHFVLKPTVTTLSPKTGSQAGGTRLTITGDGFSNASIDNTVLVGSTECDVVTASFDTIVCTTRASIKEAQLVSVIVNKETSVCVAVDPSDCKYTFAADRTPVVTTATPGIVNSPRTEFRFQMFQPPTADVTVTIGNQDCGVTEVSSQLVKCVLPGIVFGSHTVTLHESGKGFAKFDGASDVIDSNASVSSVTPTQSSRNGGLTITIAGNGFNPTSSRTSVTIGGEICEIVTVTYGAIKCVTPPHSLSSAVTLQVTVASESTSLDFPSIEIAYTGDATPDLSSLSISTGKGGDVLTIFGTGLDVSPSDGAVRVRIGDEPCVVISSDERELDCTLAPHAAGSYDVDVLVPGKGRATSRLSFTYSLSLGSVIPNESGFGGGRILVFQGYGFDPSAKVRICGNECILSPTHNTTTTELACEAPSHILDDTDVICNIKMTLNDLSSNIGMGFTYKVAQTSQIASVTPPRGGTGGGTTLTIQGSGFSDTQSDNVVTIDGTECAVTFANSTLILCTTGSHSRTIETKVRVEVGNNGKAIDEAASFFYVDVWSSPFTWGYNNPPEAGTFVTIKKGQTILLDQDTPVLKFLLIQGGALIFDMEKPSLHLQAENILITDNGCLQVGTENDPFPGQALITLHGHVRSREIPVFGTKTIALREGKLDLHGLHVPITWTHLNSTAEVNATQLHLVKQVSWKPGDQIILAPTGKSQREFEEFTITAVLNDNYTLEVSPPLKYKHISIVQTFDGFHKVETRAEVGLLTRNVRVRGSVHSAWTEKIEACKDEFRPGQFQTQTCFQGKFGEEVGSDEFGVTIMIHAPEESKNLVTARFSYVEISHAGQAFRLGRYPIHFHLSGDVSGSYVRGCAIHHSFNRAITMHGIHNLHVSHNVVFNVRGNCFFMEDGIETGNVVEYNLGIFVIASTSALNVDITPATYWVTNANNTVRHNAAAGGSHFGFWYQMFEHPDGPSFRPDYCPRNVFMLEFFNNSAHSFGRYGLWIFPVYHPMEGGGCRSIIVKPAVFGSFIAYNNMRGAEAVKIGAVQMHDFKMLDNDIAGIEYVFADTADAPRGGPRIKNALIVGHSQVSEGLDLKIRSNTLCTTSGIKLPQFSKLVVENVTFVNFDREGCTCYSACAQCVEFKKKGGWTTYTMKNRFVNSPRRSAFLWSHESVIVDLDGTLTGYPNGSLVPLNANLPPDHCFYSPQDSHGPHKGSICDSTVKFRRFAFNEVAPESLISKNVLLENRHGMDVVPFCIKCATHPQGWVTLLILGEEYNITFENAWQLTNITYSGKFYDMEENDHIWIKHWLVQTPDHFTTTGAYQNKTDVTPPANAQHGNWSFVNETKEFTYIASGRDAPRTPNKNIEPRDVTLRVYRCFYEKCIVPVPPPPPKGRPEKVQLWSKVDDWEGTEPMYGGYGRRLPTNGSDVMILTDWYMVADIELPYLNQLFIYGTLEIDDRPGMVLNASIILVTGGLIVGWPEEPYLSNFMISLQGNVDSEDLPLRDVNIGSKAIAVFGFLWMHGQPKEVYWTHLAVNAEAGDLSVLLSEPVDWGIGDEIVITSTTVEPRQTEKFFIKAITQNRRNLTLDKALQYKHIAVSHTAGNWSYILAAEVGLLTRNIRVEGADHPTGAWDQSFGCRVLIGKTSIDGIEYKGNARIENVEFSRCGQEGWIDDYDPRFALAFLNTGDVEGNTSYVRGNSFHDGFNTGIGVLGTNNLNIEDNIVHHTVGPSIRVTSSFVSLLRNLAVYSISIHTYNGRKDKSNLHWPGAIEVDEADEVILINNTVAGSERFGFKIGGEKCSDGPGVSVGNEVHGAWHGIHLPYKGGILGCSMLSGYLTWRNYDYGIFLYGEPSVIIDNVISVENTVGMLPNVWGPHALSHQTADKYVIVRNTLIVGTSPGYDCEHDSILPYARKLYAWIDIQKTPEGGKIGITLSQFSSLPARGPIMTWESPHDYSAINGYTLYHEVTFYGFQETCGKRHQAIMSNKWIGDIIHPMDARGLHFISVDEESKLLLNVPTLQWVNPSDCVDMDCDARRQILIRDLDGSLTGAVGGSVLAKAEFEWGGDKRYGLGDYRVPKPATTRPDGTRLDMSAVAPEKGIVRGTRGHSMCSWYATWNAYKCSDIDYRMLVIESLDADTETRRLSPVALIANGYVNLLNGPMDHGWCLGYTCQERISTFYGIVATGTNYSLYFTSSEPQKLRLHLLNSDPTDAVRVGIFYQRPQRQDVFRKGIFINPTNARLQGSEFTLIDLPAGAPDDYFEPPLTSVSGANYFDRERATLFVVLRGSDPVDIMVMPVVKVQIGMKAVSIDDFFKENLVNNLAGLLGIDKSLIRVVNIVSADGSGRRRRRSASDVSVEIEIADPPRASNTSSSSNYTGVNKTTSYDELKEIGDSVVENVQTGHLAQQLNTEIVSLSITDPVPEPVDPTGGVRATNETYQQNVTGNSTLRYDEVQAEKEAGEASNVFNFLIPSRLEVVTEPNGGNETVPFTTQPKLKLVDVDGKLVTTLGHGSLSNWTVMAVIQNDTGDSMAVLEGNVTVTLVKGWANFTDLSITHNGSDYKLFFYVNKPAASHFNATSHSFEVKERIMYFTVATQPEDANETVSFGQQPRIEVRDSANGKIVDNTGWKGRRWLFTASLANPADNDGHLNGTAEVEFVEGVASFSNLSIDISGKNYILALEAKTDPASSYVFTGNSSAFNVSERMLYLKLVQQPGDCNDTVVCGSQPILEIRNAYPDTLVDNIGWRGRTWSINATMVGADNSVVNGTTLFPVQTTGRVEFQDLRFFDVAQEHQMKFTVITEPVSSYSSLFVTSETFNVSAREFYLEVITQPDKANQSEIFGVPPVVEVRDLGTRMRGNPLKGYWSISASLKPSDLNGTLSGVLNVTVEEERVEFNNLSVSFYGIGYELVFESNQGHVVNSQPFEVRYINDYSPVFDPDSGSYSASISEDTSVGTTVVTVTATDQDSGSQGDVSFSIVAGNNGDKFSIDSSTGVITTIAEFDRETTAVFTLTVRASDGAVAEKVRFTDGQVVVTISDINDNAPSFNNPSVATTVQEDASTGDVVITLNAHDPDEGLNSKVLYSIIKGNEAGIFTINSTSGEVQVNASVDLDQEPTPDFNHYLVVLAKDMGTPSMNTSVTVNISIVPVNEFTPQLQHNPSYNFSFDENEPAGDGVFVFDVNATDQDYGEQGRVTFVISSGNDEGKFSLNASTGELTLIASLDYETSPSYTLTIHARDSDHEGNVKFALFTVHVSVLDLNDNAPTFSQPQYEVNVDEDTAVGSDVFTFLASDPDGGLNGLVSYSILVRNSTEFSDGLWSINSSNGKLTLNASLDMDNRKLSTWTHTLVVGAQDAGTPLLSSNTTLIVHVILKNEFTPSFASSDVSIIVNEDIVEGSVIYNANATDADFGVDGEIVYSITDGNNDLRFMIDSTNGIITNDALLDREAQPTYSLIVTARDQATSNSKSGTTTVHISLKDVNDNTPTFVKNFYSKLVDETVTAGGEIITVKANDPDFGSNSDLTYSIVSGNDLGFFSIESKQGIIRAAKDLDIETQNHTADRTYQLVVFVKDAGTPVPRNSSVPLAITVQNVNDFTPVLDHADNQIIELRENTSIGAVIFDVNATDGDYGEDGVLSYSLTDGNSLETFDIDNVTGVITLAKELDFETVGEHNLEVTVSDSSLDPSKRKKITAHFRVRVINIDDSGMYTAKARLVLAFIASPMNPAGLAGVPHKSALEVLLLYENGTEMDITLEGDRYTIDDSTKSNGLFSATTNGAPYIEANDQGLFGTGKLIVHVTNVNSVEVNVTVVGSTNLTISAVPYPETSGASKVTELKQVIQGHYQRVLLKVLLGLTNEQVVDVSNKQNTSFTFKNAPQIGGTYKFGPSPSNLFSIEGSGLRGEVWLQAEFARSHAVVLNLPLSSTVSKPVNIVRFGLENVNMTLSGLALEKTTSAFAEILVDDGSSYFINNFTSYSGLLSFSSSNPASAKIDALSGVVTLVADSSSRVIVTASLIANASITNEFAFYCNLEPNVGEIDIGEKEGPPIPSLDEDDTWKMPIRVNPGSLGILAVQVEIQFDLNDLQLDRATTGLPYKVAGNTVIIFGPIAASEAFSESVGELSFTSKKNGVPRVMVQVFRTLNRELSAVPSKNVTVSPCSNEISGDVDLDCTFDIVDVAFINGLITAPYKSRFTDEMKKRMDVNWNEVIDVNDAFFLSLIYLESAKFVTELTYQVPDHNKESSDRCGLEFSLKLANKDGSPAVNPQTEVYFVFSHQGAYVGAQLARTKFSSGTPLAIDGASFVDGLIKASFANEKFIIATANSELQATDVGVTVLQEITIDGTKHVVAMLPSSNPVSSLNAITWTKNQANFTPQRMLQLSESTAACHENDDDPLVTVPVELTFGGDYDQIIRGKEEQFQSYCENQLSTIYPAATFSDFRVRKGSIIVTFNMTLRQSKKQAMVDNLWDDVKEGLEFEFNGATITTRPIMRVDGEEKKIVDAPKDEEGMALYIIIIACVVGFLVIFLVVIVIYYRCRRSKVGKINPTPPETPDIFTDSEKDCKVFGVEAKHLRPGGSATWSVHSSRESMRSDDKIKSTTPVAFAQTVEPAFEEIEEPLPSSESPKLTSEDDFDRPNPILAFPAVPSKQGTPRTTPSTSRKSSPVHSSKGSLRTSVDTDTSSIPPTPPELSVSTRSSQTGIQSPVQSLQALEETLVIGDVLDDDDHDDDDEFEENPRQGAMLRRRASSFGDNMPGVVVVTDQVVKRRKMQVKVIRPNAEMGTLAHMAGIVNAKKGGTLAELREDINRSLPGYLGSVRYLFISRKFKIIDPRTETQLVVSALYKKTVYVKVFHGAESCEYFCLCGKPAQVWCKKCDTQGYCGDDCKEQDEEQHSSICSKSKARAMENARTRRVSKISKK